jgi:hypothetical protein
MNHFDDLPRHDRSHDIEEEAIIALQRRLSESRVFILQRADRKDYGTDCQIEVIDDGRATNVRVQAQLKGTERALNADGSLSVEVRRTNLNYLLMQGTASTPVIMCRVDRCESAPSTASFASMNTAERRGPSSSR